MRTSIPGGQAACREVIAYMLDRERRAGVPATALVCAEHRVFFDLAEEELLAGSPASQWSLLATSKSKIGSCQRFVESVGDCEDLPMSTIRRFARAEVHKIAVLDLALFNTDRHGGNILRVPVDGRTAAVPSPTGLMHASGGSSEDEQHHHHRQPSAGQHGAPHGEEPCYRLVPIDHGYTLPENFSEAWFDWLTWPQAAEPFDQETRDYIDSLSWRADSAVLRKFQAAVSAKSRTVHRVALAWLQAGARANLTPRTIATAVCRSQLDRYSRLEKLVARAKHDAGLAGPIDPDADEEDSPFWRCLHRLLVRQAERLASKKHPVQLVFQGDADDESEDDTLNEPAPADAADPDVLLDDIQLAGDIHLQEHDQQQQQPPQPKEQQRPKEVQTQTPSTTARKSQDLGLFQFD